MATTTPIRRRKGEGSVSRHHRPSCTGGDNCRCGWRARVTVEVNGRRVRKTLYSPTEKGILRAVKKLRGEEAAGTILSERPVTVAEWLEAWFSSAAPTLKLNTRKGYRSKLDTYLIPQLGHHRLDRLEPGHVRALYVAMRKQGLAESSCRQTHAILRRSLKIAVREGKVARNVCDMIDPPKTTTKRREGLSVADAWKVLRLCGDDPRFWIALMCGLRQGEALALRWSDIYLDEPVPYLVVRRAVSWGPDGPEFGTPKSAASTNRVVPLVTPVAARLKLARSRAAAGGCGADDLVFMGSTGQPLQPHLDWMKWKTTLEVAGVQHVALHAARNTTAQLLENAGAQPRVVAQILGHSHVDMTHHYQTGNLAAAVDGIKALETYMASVEHAAS